MAATATHKFVASKTQAPSLTLNLVLQDTQLSRPPLTMLTASQEGLSTSLNWLGRSISLSWHQNAEIMANRIS